MSSYLPWHITVTQLLEKSTGETLLKKAQKSQDTFQNTVKRERQNRQHQFAVPFKILNRYLMQGQR